MTVFALIGALVFAVLIGVGVFWIMTNVTVKKDKRK